MIHRNHKKFDNMLIQSLSKEFLNEEELITYLKKQMAIEIIKEMSIDELSKVFTIFQDDSPNEISLELICWTNESPDGMHFEIVY
jgi:Mg/Co/Ni transporter MgtE